MSCRVHLLACSTPPILQSQATFQALAKVSQLYSVACHLCKTCEKHVCRLHQPCLQALLVLFASFAGQVCRLHRSCLQALLEEWRSELARKPLAMTEKEACSVLGVQPEEGQDQEGPLSEDALKAAYRQAALLCPQITMHLLCTVPTTLQRLNSQNCKNCRGQRLSCLTESVLSCW